MGSASGQRPPSNLPVRFIEEYVWAKALDPEHVNLMRLHNEAHARIVSGESTVEEEWGKPVSTDELRQMFGGPRRYPLPKHLHWMGEQ